MTRPLGLSLGPHVDVSKCSLCTVCLALGWVSGELPAGTIVREKERCTATEGQQLPVPKTETFEQGLEGCIGVCQQGQAGRDLTGNSALATSNVFWVQRWWPPGSEP